MSSDSGENTGVASQYALEIVYPRAAGSAPDLDSTNRCFFAYPGLTYEIPLVAGWGTYPYTWEVSGGEAGKFSVVEYTMASGMTGHLLRYTNPQDGDDTSITITCTDAASDTDSVSYSITVGTSGWYFLDGSTDGSGDTGTISAPFDTLSQAFSGMAANGRLYIRAGTYTLTGISTTNPSGLPNGAQGSEMRIDWSQGTRGACFIAYPGDSSPVIDFEYDHTPPDPTTGYASPVPRIRVSGAAIFIDGLTLLDPMVMGFQLGRSGNHGSVVWRNAGSGGGPSTGLGDNAAYFMYIATYGGGGTPGTQIYGDVMVSNELHDTFGTADPCGFKLYSMYKPVIQGNYLYGFNNHEALAIKSDISQFMTLANRFGADAGISGNHDSHNTGEETYGDHAYNWFEADSTGLRIGNARVDDFIGRIDVYRNTLSDIYVENLQTTDGPYVFEKNAVQNSQSSGSPWPWITDSSIADSDRLTWGDNLANTSGVFDENGDLLDPEGVGTYGHVIP